MYQAKTQYECLWDTVYKEYILPSFKLVHHSFISKKHEQKAYVNIYDK